MSALAELLARAAQDHDDEDRPKILPEAQVMRLREAAGRFLRDLPFKVGDLVTPIKGSNIKGAGVPHLVIVARPDAEYTKTDEPGSTSFGKKLDIRVLTFVGDRVVPFWGESADYEVYNE